MKDDVAISIPGLHQTMRLLRPDFIGARNDFFYTINSLLKTPRKYPIVSTNTLSEGVSGMDQGDWYILVIVGGIFIILGIIGIFWGIREEKRLFEALAAKRDLREFSLNHVESPQPGALKTGGWIAISLGVIVLLVGIIMWQLG